MNTTSENTIMEMRYFGAKLFRAITKYTNAAYMLAIVKENMLNTSEYCAGVRSGNSISIKRVAVGE